MTDLLSFLVVALFALRGMSRGLLLSAISLLGIVGGYAAAYYFYRPLGSILGSLFSLQPLVSYPLGSLAAFILTAIFFSVLGVMVRRRRRRLRRAGKRPPLLGQVGGALLGAGHGAVIVLLVVWVLLLLRAAFPERIPDVSQSVSGRLAMPLSAKVARVVAGGVGGGEAALATAEQMVRDPVKTSRNLRALLQDRRLQTIFQDPEVISALAKSDHEALGRNLHLRELASDKQFIRRARRAGLLSGGAEALGPDEVLRQLASRLAPMARAVTAMAADPEIRKLVQDKRIVELLRRKDFAILANDSGFNRLMEIMLQRLRNPPASAPALTPEDPAQEGAPAKGGKEPRRFIYKWTDKDGTLHITDKPPPGKVRYEVTPLNEK